MFKTTKNFIHPQHNSKHIAYELGSSGSYDSDPTLKNCLFGAVTLTKNAHFDKYGYSGYRIGFDKKSSFSFPGGRHGQNVLIFGADMSSSAHIDNKKKDISSWKRTNTRSRTYTNYYSNKKKILFKYALQWRK